MAIFTPCLLQAQNKHSEKKLIEFGWDYPSISSLKANIPQMANAPFDGVFFSLDFDIYNAFDTTQYPDSKFQFDDLAKIKWGEFSDNFLLVRGAAYTGARWLDDESWAKINQNLTKISKALTISKAKGIGFDPEYYFKDSTLNPWTYSPFLYNNLTYDEVGNYVRKRGKQFMQALQTYKPDVKLFCFWLLGLVDMQNKSQLIDKTGMALYPFFVDGMLEGQNKLSEIIDGNESSYWYQKPENFIESGEYLRYHGSNLIQKPLQLEFKKISIAQSVYFDGLYAKSPEFEKGFDKQTKERWLQNNLYYAFKTTDKYVWFYNEKINWWKKNVDSGLAEIVDRVRDKINSEANNNSSENNGRSMVLDFKKKELENYQGFFYNYLKDENLLKIKLLKNGIKNLQVYKNSRIIYNIENPAISLTINLNKKYNKEGDLIIIAKDSEGKTSVSFVN
ncbi:MAG: hypothetical protein ABI472_14565 [Ginsengibacter sp.]